MKYEYKRMLCEDWNFDNIPELKWFAFCSSEPFVHLVRGWTRHTTRNQYIRDNLNNEEHREMVFSDRVFNNVPIDKDKDRL